MFADNSPNDKQTKTGPAAFGRKVGLENPAQMFGRNPAPGIGKADDDVAIVAIGPDAQNPAALHRFETVLNRIVENLLQLVTVEFDSRQIGTQLGFDHNLAILDLGLEKTKRLLHNRVHFFAP